MKKTATPPSSVKNVFILYALLLVVWGFYRVLFKLPDIVEELILKPIIWLGPLFYFLAKEKKGFSSLGWTFNGVFRAIYLGLGAGVIFSLVAVLSNALKYGGLSINTDILQGQSILLGLSLSVVTAIVEESVFRGYMFSRVETYLKDSIIANTIVSICWGIIHLPVLIFSYHLDPSGILIQFILSFVFSFGAGLVFSKTRNIVSPIILSVLWTWPIVLFR